jgi:hypothetical protein
MNVDISGWLSDQFTLPLYCWLSVRPISMPSEVELRTTSGAPSSESRRVTND